MQLPHDPGILYIPVEEPENLVLDLPLPLFPEDGAGTILQEIVEEASHVVNQRPRIQPIPEQRVLEGQTFSYAVGAGSAGVYQATVKATDDRGGLSQTDEEVVTILLEGSS